MWKVKLLVVFVFLNVCFWIGEIKLGLLQKVDLQALQDQSHQFLYKFIDFEKKDEEQEAKYSMCPKKPIVVAEQTSFTEFSAQMWLYADTWGLGKYLKRKAYATKTMLDLLKTTFPNLTLTPFEEISHCNISRHSISENFEPLETLEMRTGNKSLWLWTNEMLPAAVLPFLDEARVEFEFNTSITAEVNRTIHKIGGVGRVLVGVHVKRSKKYVETLRNRYQSTLANASYYLDAMQWFRDNVGGRILFVIMCDDDQWTRTNLLGMEDVVIATKNNAHDLALLCHVDHLIMDYGMYGTWASMMTKGHIIALMLFDMNKHFEKHKKFHLFDESKYSVRNQR
ncbi:Hypothetical predicted protein [Cloeon dipterum]|uniref:L-Fucosyltransferase n=1 Tax=Cloeon dipterum TaxID=197152 RepID=A0A8S1CEM5_9INSE|nr:Hypothetical predicted protein [Cloeon dipterum]